MTSGYPILESLHLCMANDTCSGYSKKDRPGIGWSHHLDHLYYIPQVLDLSGDAIDKEVEIYIYIWKYMDCQRHLWNSMDWSKRKSPGKGERSKANAHQIIAKTTPQRLARATTFWPTLCDPRAPCCGDRHLGGSKKLQMGVIMWYY